jgi:hypothetical protein
MRPSFVAACSSEGGPNRPPLDNARRIVGVSGWATFYSPSGACEGDESGMGVLVVDFILSAFDRLSHVLPIHSH